MNDRFQRIDAVFDAALDLPTSDQAAYIERTLSEEPELRAEVIELLKAHHRTGSILDAPVARLEPMLYDRPAAGVDATGNRVGPFRVERAIGQGGMGQVYLGVRDDGQFEQRVALKLIRHPSPGLIRRFIDERRILARLEHPRIARLVDGGITGDGLPYFAMEFVDGEPIDTYCESRNLSIDERLGLFEQVCEAVSYAHHHLVIHRDIKPGNILVAPDAHGAGRVKLLDFGIAKLLDAPGGQALDETRTGFRVMTPDVAAPEQVRGQPVSTATDVYSLGILLYQLLAGDRPYDVRNKPPSEIHRIICDVVPPPPSAKAPEWMRKHISSDLDLIVMTALHKQQERRYQSAAELSQDVQRLRQGFAIQARPDSAGYRLGKFIRRHRAASAVAAVLLVVAAFGVVRERVLRQRAELEARKATAVQDFLVKVFEVSDPLSVSEPQRGTITARDLLDRGAKRIDSTLAEQPEVQAELRTVLGRVYTNLGLFDEAASMFERSLAQQTALRGEQDTSVARNMDLLGAVRTQQNKHEEAERLLRAALAQRRRQLGRVHEATAESVNNLATLLEETDRLAEAESLHAEALAIKVALFGDSSVEAAFHMNNLGLVKYRRGAYAQAESLYRRALAVDQKRLGDNHPETAATLHNLAQTQVFLGKMDDAETNYRKSLAAKRVTLGDAHPSITIGLNNLGIFLAVNRNKLAEADTLVREAMMLDAKNLGAEHSYVAEGLRNLSIVQRMKGEFAASDSAILAAIRIQRALFGDQSEKVAGLLGQRSQTRYMMRDSAGAIQLARQSVAAFRKTLGDSHRSTVITIGNLARLLAESGLGAESETLAREALAQLDSANAGARPSHILTLRTLGAALLAQRKTDAALPVLQRAHEMAVKEFGADNQRTAHVRITYGNALAAKGRYAEARPLLESANAVFDKAKVSQPRLAAQAATALAALGARR